MEQPKTVSAVVAVNALFVVVAVALVVVDIAIFVEDSDYLLQFVVELVDYCSSGVVGSSVKQFIC